LIVGRVNHGFVSPQPIETNRPFLAGSVEQVHTDLRDLEAWGADEVFFNVQNRYFQQPDGFHQMMEQITLLRGVV
jgi:hypothetical protein